MYNTAARKNENTKVRSPHCGYALGERAGIQCLVVDGTLRMMVATQAAKPALNPAERDLRLVKCPVSRTPIQGMIQ